MITQIKFTTMLAFTSNPFNIARRRLPSFFILTFIPSFCSYRSFSAKSFIFLFTFFSLILSAQEQLTGTVYQSGTEMPLLGVNIIKKGTKEGITTDFDGNFSLNQVDEGDIIIFSYLGFKTLEYTCSDQRDITIYLEEDTDLLDEIVVVGYGSQLKSNVVGSVVSVEVEKAKQIPTRNYYVEGLQVFKLILETLVREDLQILSYVEMFLWQVGTVL
ncbi:MAG: hypothetical protein EBS74_01115 [Flavobacteriia bacterium]|nr:hypothetical protein [Flavobacteriia bacterium]